jgi:hypothetical protein
VIPIIRISYGFLNATMEREITERGSIKPKISVVTISGKVLQERSRTVPRSTAMPSDFMNMTVLPGVMVRERTTHKSITGDPSRVSS